MNVCCFSLRFRRAFAEEPCHANPGQVVPQGPGNCERAHISKNIFLSVIFVILLPLPLCCHWPICKVVCLSQITGSPQLKGAEAQRFFFFFQTSNDTCL